MAEPQVSFKIGTDNLPAIEDGSLIVKTDTKQLFVDDGSQRYEIGPYDIVKTWNKSATGPIPLTTDEITVLNSNNSSRIVISGTPTRYLYRYSNTLFYSGASIDEESALAARIVDDPNSTSGKSVGIFKLDDDKVFVVEFTSEGSQIKSSATFEDTLSAYENGKFLIGISNATTYLLQNYAPATVNALPSFQFLYMNTRPSGSKIVTETGTLVFRPDRINFAYNKFDTLNSTALANTYVTKTELENKTHLISLQYSRSLSTSDTVQIDLSDSDIKYIQENYYHTRIKVQDNDADYIFYPSYVVLLAGVAFNYETLADDINNPGYQAYLTSGYTTLTINKRDKVATANSLNKKLDKITTSSSKARVYAVTSSGTQTSYSVSTNPVSLDIPMIDTNGQLHVALVPTDSNSATSKKYVDDAVAGGGGSDTHITWDSENNATFPANITATKFIGDGSELTGISRDSDVLVAKFTKPGSTYVCNKTFSEIKAAIDAGKSVTAVVNSQSGYAIRNVYDDSVTFTLTLSSKAGPGCNVRDVSMTLHSDGSTSYGTALTWMYSKDNADSTFALKTDFDSMVVSISYDDATSGYTADKTFTEIHDAIVNKKSVFLSYLPTGQYYTLESYSASNIIFTVTYTSPMPAGVQVVQDQVSISSENVISPRTVRQTEIKNYDEIISKIFSGSESVGNSLALGGTDASGWQKKITYGTAAPSGGEDGDIYIQLQS